MKKNDLKNGMWLELRNGKMVMVLLNTRDGDILSGETWMPIISIKEDLTHSCDCDYDVMKIYQPRSNMAYLRNFPKIDETIIPIWERKKANEERIRKLRINISNEENRLQLLNGNLSSMKVELEKLEKESDM